MDQFWTYNLLATLLQYKAFAAAIAIAVIIDFFIKFSQVDWSLSTKDKALYAAGLALVKFILVVIGVVLLAVGLEILTYFFGWISSDSKW